MYFLQAPEHKDLRPQRIYSKWSVYIYIYTYILCRPVYATSDWINSKTRQPRGSRVHPKENFRRRSNQQIGWNNFSFPLPLPLPSAKVIKISASSKTKESGRGGAGVSALGEKGKTRWKQGGGRWKEDSAGSNSPRSNSRPRSSRIVCTRYDTLERR